MASANTGANVDVGGIASLDAGYYEKQQIYAQSDGELAEARANSSLPPDSWVSMDDQLFRGEDETLKLIADLRGAGLTSDAEIEDEELTWLPVDTSHEATISMTVETATDEGAATYGKQGVPLPVIHSDYSSGFREDGAGSNQELNAFGSSYVVNRTYERMVLYGWSPTIGADGYELHGIVNHPAAGTGTVQDWTTDPTFARADVRDMKNQIKNAQNHSPGTTGYWLYLADDLWDLTENFVEPTERITILDDIQSLSSISRIDNLPALASGSMLMFRPTLDVIDLAEAMSINTVQWGGPFRDHFKTMLAGTPRVKSTLQGNSGITYWQ